MKYIHLKVNVWWSAEHFMKWNEEDDGVVIWTLALNPVIFHRALRGPAHWESFSTDWFGSDSSIHVIFSWHPLHSDLSARLSICKTDELKKPPLLSSVIQAQLLINHLHSPLKTGAFLLGCTSLLCIQVTKETWGCSFTTEPTGKAWTVSNWHLYKSSEELGQNAVCTTHNQEIKRQLVAESKQRKSGWESLPVVETPQWLELLPLPAEYKMIHHRTEMGWQTF